MSLKISIITACLNSDKTILHTLNSVITQDYKNIEHVIIDGGSTDKTLFYLKKYDFRNKKILYKKNLSLYSSLNEGIKNSTGDIITFLHSDDIYNSTETISKVINKIKYSKSNIFFGDVVYFANQFDRPFRLYNAKNFNPKSMIYGNMPPHTGSYYKKEIFEKYGLYKNFKIAGDFEHLLRIIYIAKEKFTILNLITTRMKSGGLSSKNFNSYLTINTELVRALKLNQIYTNYLYVCMRLPSKISQFFLFKNKKLNHLFKIKFSDFFFNHDVNHVKLINDFKKLDFKKNFYLSALNLAFLGAYAKNEINLNHNMINWPDGIFSRFYSSIKKTPGRELFNKIRIPRSFNRIIVMGNISNNGMNFLKKKYKKKIKHIKLPYGDINSIKKNIKFKFKKTDFIFITLPTPKQEQLADYFSKKNRYFKIVCIGGSINIACGDEKVVPKKLIYFEFLWRLRYETFRRIKRLFKTFNQVLFDKFFSKKLDKLMIIIK